MATEIDVGGVKFRGGKLFLIITILSSFVGVLWGGFEAYQRYLTMEKKINSFHIIKGKLHHVATFNNVDLA